DDIRAGVSHGRGSRLLALPVVRGQGAALDRLVDRADELAVVSVGTGIVAGGHPVLQPAQVGLDARRVLAVLQALALGALDSLDLGVDVRHEKRIAADDPPRRPPTIADPWPRTTSSPTCRPRPTSLRRRLRP